MIDYDLLEQQAVEVQPKMIIGGGSAYPRQFDFPRMRQIADKVGAFFLVDMAHFAGLVAGGAHPSRPCPTRMWSRRRRTKPCAAHVPASFSASSSSPPASTARSFPASRGGPLMHIVAAKAVAFREALEPAFAQYAAQVVANAKVLAAAIAEKGFRIISGGTDTHVVLIDVFGHGAQGGMLGSEAEHALGEAGITVNKNAIPYDTNPPLKPSGIRIGTPALTTRGMKEAEMLTVAAWIVRAPRAP